MKNICHIVILLTLPVLSVFAGYDIKPDTLIIQKSNNVNLEKIPDYFQRDGAFGGFPDNGSMYCGPTAASNAIIQLSKQLDIALYEQTGNAKKDQYELIKKLGSDQYFKTDKDGSGPAEICRGLQKYFTEHQINSVKIRHFGWRNVAGKFNTQQKVPNLDSARAAFSNNAAVLVNFGWYEFDKKSGGYTRKGGHWVTLAGYGYNGKKPDSSYIIIHDPETPWRFNDYVKLETITSGKLEGSVKELPVDATGYLRFPSGFDRYGVIDGFITISIQPRDKPIA